MSTPTFAEDTITMLEIEEFRELTGLHFGDEPTNQTDIFKVPYALYFLVHRRSDPTLTYEAVKGLPVARVFEWLGLKEDEHLADPTEPTEAPGDDESNETETSSSIV